MNMMVWPEDYSITSLIVLLYLILYLFRGKIFSLIEKYVEKKSLLDFLIRLASNFRLGIDNIWRDLILPITSVLVFDIIITLMLIESISHSNFTLPQITQIINPVILHPIAEEILVRGLFLGVLLILCEYAKDKTSDFTTYTLYAIVWVLQAYIFAICHINPTYLSFLIRFVSGLLYGFLYIFSKRNLLPPIIAHAIHNLYTFLVLSI